MSIKSPRNFVAKHARQQQRATVMKDRKREAKKQGHYAKRRFSNKAPFFMAKNQLTLAPLG